MTFTILVLWLLDADFDQRQLGRFVEAQEVFLTLEDCTEAIPRYEEKVIADFNSRGIVACVERRETMVAGR